MFPSLLYIYVYNIYMYIYLSICLLIYTFSTKLPLGWIAPCWYPMWVAPRWSPRLWFAVPWTSKVFDPNHWGRGWCAAQASWCPEASPLCLGKKRQQNAWWKLQVMEVYGGDIPIYSRLVVITNLGYCIDMGVEFKRFKPMVVFIKLGA